MTVDQLGARAACGQSRAISRTSPPPAQTVHVLTKAESPRRATPYGANRPPAIVSVLAAAGGDLDERTDRPGQQPLDGDLHGVQRPVVGEGEVGEVREPRRVHRGRLARDHPPDVGVALLEREPGELC